MTAKQSGETGDAARVREILATVKPLAVQYYELTGRPLGVTGEIAEYVAANHLGLTLAPPRTAGYNALRGDQRILVRGRACGEKNANQQTLTKINREAPCDVVLLVLLDKETLEIRGIHEATFAAVLECLARPGSKARARGVLRVSEFKRIARSIFPERQGAKSGAAGRKAQQ